MEKGISERVPKKTKKKAQIAVIADQHDKRGEKEVKNENQIDRDASEEDMLEGSKSKSSSFSGVENSQEASN